MRVELREIRKSFGAVRANDGITLAAAAGTIHGVLGENGAGKSTLMKILSGMLAPDGGEILLDGTPVRFSWRRRRSALTSAWCTRIHSTSLR